MTSCFTQSSFLIKKLSFDDFLMTTWEREVERQRKKETEKSSLNSHWMAQSRTPKMVKFAVKILFWASSSSCWTLLYLPRQNSMLDEHFLGFFFWDFYIVDYGNSIKHYKALSRPPKSTKKKLSFVSKKKRQKLRCTKAVCYYKKQACVWTL